MAHKQKYTKNVIGHMFSHYDRSKEIPDLPVPTNTILNYNLAKNDQPKNQLDFLHQRLSEVKVHNRKDVNVMVDWVVTVPKDLSSSDEDKFFEETYKFLNKRYGKENVISSYVHLDETTAHMHYAFIPIVEDRKKGGYKLSAKEAITREDLRTFHGDLSNYLKEIFGHDISILNESTKEGNKSIIELKRRTAVEQINKATCKAEQIIDLAKETVTNNLAKMEQDIQATKIKCDEMLQNASKIVENIQGNINHLKDKKKALESKLEGLEARIKGTELKINEINQICPEKTFTGTIKGITIEDIDNLKKTAIVSVRALKDVKTLSQENKQLQYKIKDLEKQVPSIIEKIKKTKEDIKLAEIEKAFNLLPEDTKNQLLTNNKLKTFKENKEK